MSNSAPPPNSSPSDDDDDSSKTTPPLDSNSPPPSSNSESSPPPPPPPPPLDSKSSPPSSNSESSPPLDSKSPPPSSNSESSPPPLDSKSPPPSSDSQAPPPPTESKSPPPSPDSEASPPPQGLSSNSSSKTPPTSNETNSPPPQAKSTVPSPSESKSPPPNSPPLSKSNSPPPHPSNTSDVVSPLSPPSQTLSPSNHSRYPPPTRSPLSQSAVPINPSPPSTSGKHEKISSRHTDSSPAGSSETRNDALSIGTGLLAIIGILVVLAAIFSVVSKKRRRREALAYQIGPSSFSVKADGYYHRQTNQPGVTGYSGPYYGPGASLIYSSGVNTSHRGQQYLSGAQEPPGSKSCFTYEELISITNNFSQENLIGEGGFGCVYKGWLPDGRCVAVKQLKSGSGQGEREFRAEVEIISRVHHRHLVSLVGYCIAEYHRMLIYEFVPNGTLEEHLHGKGVPVTDWSQRMKIAIGSARGLAYLHEDCHPRIIHRDIKSANILLDSEFEAQVADFGLARLSNDTHTPVSTRVMGTFGYLAPEYASSGKLSDRSDVYSFGVVLLELITGRMPVDTSQPIGDESLVEWARPLLIRAIETEDCAKLVDVRLQNNYVKSEMLRMIEVAAACVRHSAPKRPRMAQVLRALDNEGYMADLSNGVKVGQSRQFDCNQYSTDIEKFRRMAFAIDECSSEFEHTGEQGNWSSAYGAPQRPPVPWKNGEHSSEDSGHESETRAMNLRTYDKDSSSRY